MALHAPQLNPVGVPCTLEINSNIRISHACSIPSHGLTPLPIPADSRYGDPEVPLNLPGPRPANDNCSGALSKTSESSQRLHVIEAYS